MTVQDLIEQLQRMDPHLRVVDVDAMEFDLVVNRMTSSYGGRRVAMMMRKEPKTEPIQSTVYHINHNSWK